MKKLFFTFHQKFYSLNEGKYPLSRLLELQSDIPENTIMNDDFIPVEEYNNPQPTLFYVVCPNIKETSIRETIEQKYKELYNMTELTIEEAILFTQTDTTLTPEDISNMFELV